MEIKPLEWTEYIDTRTQQLRICAHFLEIGTEYDLGFEITEKFGKHILILQNYYNGTDYHGLGQFGNLETAKNAAQGYANEVMNDIKERFVE